MLRGRRGLVKGKYAERPDFAEVRDLGIQLRAV